MNKENIIILREQKKKDTLISYKWRNIKSIWEKTVGEGNFIDKKITLKDEISWYQKCKNNNMRKNLSIIVNDKFVGYVYFTDIIKKKAQFQIVIGNKLYWKKGIGFKATYLSLYFAKANYNLSKFYLKVKNENIYAIKIYKKVGFKFKKKYSKDGSIMMECKIG